MREAWLGEISPWFDPSTGRDARADNSPDFPRRLGYRLGRLMAFGLLQDFIMRGRLVFVIVRLDVVFAHGMVFEFVPHQDAAQIRVAVEPDTEQVVDFALL